MKKILCYILLAMLCAPSALAIDKTNYEGKCNSQVKWSFDGQTLTIEHAKSTYYYCGIPDYNVKGNPSPWEKLKLPVKKVKIGYGFNRIGSCAFANCTELEAVEFYNEDMIEEIGWGAFLNCTKLFSFSIPHGIKKIEKVAFANCLSLRSIQIPNDTKVDDGAFRSCRNLNIIEIASNVRLGKGVFASERLDNNSVAFDLYAGVIRHLPTNITESNCELYGLDRTVVKEYLSKQKALSDEDERVSSVDTNIPGCMATRNDTYALVIGNQNYRFAPNVPYAKHDAVTFAAYCKTTLGIPSAQVHLVEDATKHMILEQEIESWLRKEVLDKSVKKLIVYYAGHGVPDVEESNKSYILPTDVLATTPKQAIPLDYFYHLIGGLGFKQVTVFMDACFSGIDRNNESVNRGERGTEVEAEDVTPTSGNLIVFCAAQGNETAQGYLEEGHGLFTYYLLKEIQMKEGNISYGKLAEAIQAQVSEKAPSLELRKKQTPTTKASEDLSSTWQDMPL